MTDDRIEGTANIGAGKLESGLGRVLGDSKTEISGKLREAAGKVQDAYGRAQETLDKVKDQASAARDRIEPFVNERPYAAIGIAAGIGLLLGLMMRERKVVYIRK